MAHDVNAEPIPSADLAKRFGMFRNGGVDVEREVIGDLYRRILTEVTGLVVAMRNGAIRGLPLRGFFLAGPPGCGKTTLVHRIAYELGHRLTGASNVFLVAVDGGHIARSRYGESEQRIRELLRQPAIGDGDIAVILLDDVESILMERGTDQAREWHFSQNSVFFHAVDELDTRRCILFLTSNRPDLVDSAVIDRFLRYDLPAPSAPLLLEVARDLGSVHGLDADTIESVGREITDSVKAGSTVSLREAERMVLRAVVMRHAGHELIGRI